MGKPTVYPTGVTVYNPEKCFNGYTVFPATERGAMLINMNGKVEKLWEGLQGMPNKLLPGGQVIGHRGRRDGAGRRDGRARRARQNGGWPDCARGQQRADADLLGGIVYRQLKAELSLSLLVTLRNSRQQRQFVAQVGVYRVPGHIPHRIVLLGYRNIVIPVAICQVDDISVKVGGEQTVFFRNIGAGIYDGVKLVAQLLQNVISAGSIGFCLRRCQLQGIGLLRHHTGTYGGCQ